MIYPEPFASGPEWSIYHGAAETVVPTLPATAFNAVVTDPPYGINFRHGGGGLHPGSRNLDPIANDDRDFDPSFVLSLCGASRGKRWGSVPTRAIALLGAEHFLSALPPGGRLLVWDKSLGQGPAASFVDAEFAWANRRNPRNVFRFFWMGGTRAGESAQRRRQRLHPSEKPPELMRWLMDTIRIGTGKTVLDPYMGSGTTGVACVQTGRRFIGIDIEEQWCQISADRLRALT